MALAELRQLPIADLRPEVSAGDFFVHGIVTLVWPYSSVHNTFSFLLVEPDFRLRRHRGQVRVSLRGSCARRTARAGLSSGDELRLGLRGVQWQKDQIAASTPGRGIDWELVFADHVEFERIFDDDAKLVDTSRFSTSPEPQVSTLPALLSSSYTLVSEQLNETPKRKSYDKDDTNTWSSPAFLKSSRLPDVFPSELERDPFLDDDWESGPASKRVKFGTNYSKWKFIERSPSPEKNVIDSRQGDISLAQSVESADKKRTATGLASPLVDHVAGERAVENTSTIPRVQGTSPPTDLKTHDIDVEDAANITHHAPGKPLLNGKVNRNSSPNIDAANPNLSVPRQRSRSRTLEPDLQINIQEATPLVRPAITNLRPLTPRLEPLPSPGLETVSPIYQRHHSGAGFFDARFRDNAESNNAGSIQEEIQPTDGQVESASNKSSARVSFHQQESFTQDGQGVPKPDTFFDKLLANYDLAKTLEAETNSGSIGVPDVPLLPEAFGHSNAPIAGQSYSETLDPAQKVSTSDAVRGHNQHDFNRGSVFQDQQPRSSDIESEDTEPESSYVEQSLKNAKHRDMTYKPSYEEVRVGRTEPDSPLLTDQIEPQTFVAEETTAAVQAEDSRNLQSFSEGTASVIRDTYFVDDVLGKDTQDTFDSKMELMFESDHASSPPDIINDVSLAREASIMPASESQPQVIDASREARTSRLPDLPDNNDSDVQNRETFDSDHQKFFTAPVVVEDLVELEYPDLASLPNIETMLGENNLEVNVDTTEAPEKDEISQPMPTKTVPKDSSSRLVNEDNGSIRSTTRSQVPSESQTSGKSYEEPSERTTEYQAEKIDSKGMQDLGKGFRTAHDYYLSLAMVHQFYHNTTSFLAIVVASSKPIRATTGPRDYNQTVYLASPQLPNTGEFVIAQLFRPYSKALPYPVSSGDVILLKDFKIHSSRRKPSLLSTETSAWVVFSHTAATNQSEMQASIAGPKVEFGGEERGVAWGLGRWWTNLDEESKSQILASATRARDKTEADLEQKASTGSRKTKTKGKSKANDTVSSQTQTQSQQQSKPLQEIKSSQVHSQANSSTKSTKLTSPPSTHRRTRSSHTVTAPTPVEPSSPAPEQIPSPSHRRTRSTRSTTAAGYKETDNISSEASTAPDAGLPSSPPPIPNAEHELRSGLVYSDNEDALAEIPGRSLVEE